MEQIVLRKHLNADALFSRIHRDMEKIPDHRGKNASIPLPDVLMSAFAMFSLKDPSLLAFDQRRQEEPESIHGVFNVEKIPCDSQMRSILDEVSPAHLRRPFRTVFHELQQGKALERMTRLGGYLVLAVDGTQLYSSEAIGSDYCQVRKKRNGTEEYYLQMLAGAFVAPGQREVIPICPEPIRRQDGSTKNDCERNAAKRLLADLRREHPHQKIIVVEDGLSSNAPHIKELMNHILRYILGAKPGDHPFLFHHVNTAEKGKVTELELPDDTKADKRHRFRFVHGVPLNASSQKELTVNFLEYWETETKKGTVKEQHFSWVTDLEITPENVMEIMRCGRARWKIENETFNTLKNQGYSIDHNYGLGKKHLSVNFSILTMLAFLVDQVQQLCCPLFQAALEKAGSKRMLWYWLRSQFRDFIAPSMEILLRMIVYGFERPPCPTYG